MSNIFQSKVYIVVQSKYPDILKVFTEGFKATTKEFENVKLVIEDGKEYGARIINQHIVKARDEGYEYFGVFNDDMWFSEGWLESCLELLKKHDVASAGYVETIDRKKYELAVNETKNNTDFVNHLYGPNAIFNMNIFREIGTFDENFDWTCDDLDWAWRIKLNGLSSVTSKKITIGHWHGQTRVTDIKAWNLISTKNKKIFYNKHGYQAYRNIRNEYKINHQYFVQFK
jgi:GT2 family glycosyltransferase